MGRHVIKMPDVGEGITEAEIVEWNVSVGDFVSEDEILAEVMTDKATVEIPSPVSGTILSLSGEVGDMMAVGAEIIALEVDGTDVAGTDIDQAEASDEYAASVSPDDGNAAASVEVIEEDDQEAGEGDDEDAETLPGNEPLSLAGPAVPIQVTGGKVLASPNVRRRAQVLGLDLSSVSGSGPEGRILHEDLDALLTAGEGITERITSGFKDMSGTRHAKSGVEEWKVIGLRRTIAERMQDSKSRIPHITYVEEVDVTDLEKLRAHMNEAYGAERGKLTILPFLMRAMVVAAQDVPKVSAHYDDVSNNVRQFEALHIGVAAQTDGGLMVPVVRHAESRDVYDLAGEVKRLSEAARDGSISREDLSGSTITISSLGALGGIVSTPVINSPEVAIVGVNKVMVRPVHQDGVFVPRKIMNLSSSFDHRIIDGWDAAVFIQKIKSLLEQPATLFID